MHKLNYVADTIGWSRVQQSLLREARGTERVAEIEPRRDRANGDSSNSLGRGWVCCVIDGKISPLFYFIVNNNTRRIIDFVNWVKELRNKVWKKFE